MDKIKSALKNPVMYVGLAVGVVLALGFGRFIPGAVKAAVAKLPGSDAKQQAAV